MKRIDKLIENIKINNGMISSKELTKMGFSRGYLKYLVEKGVLEKESRGIYVLQEYFPDEFLVAQNKYSRGIFSLNTALFLHNLTDRTPGAFNMTFPATYNLSNPKKEGLLCTSIIQENYLRGAESVKTPYSNEVLCYNAERTLCDIVKVTNHVDSYVIVQAFKEYLKKKDKYIFLLSSYAKQLKVEDKVNRYLEVLMC